jgi:hypothetical protein
LFNILDLLRYYDKRAMAKELWIVRHGFECLVGRFIMIRENWTKQDIIDEVFMLY